ncbi:hypothetical protein FRB96_004466 [Tulasnella sp. 330]|nr:hypothetical protein FRB96_004466 [Tulasnella sp. 330]KAG8880530.1 hypothetical protein FRB97_000700 [Tulasnella sp. 331]KAG8887198.1 hypothetical protein FRB98_000360 [Tulasnella sp. 332]
MASSAQANPGSPKSGPPRRIIVFGSGNFGSCLADHLATSDNLNVDVWLWSRDAATVKSLNETQKNPKYLTDHVRPQRINATRNGRADRLITALDFFDDHGKVFPACLKAIGPEIPEKELLDSMDMLLFAIPTPYLRVFLTNINPFLDHSSLPLLAFVNKGIEAGTRALTLEIIADTCGNQAARTSSFISGPSFAKEIVKRQPTSVTVASLSEQHALRVAELFHQPWFRCYPGIDPIGVELAGALKNVYAIATGVAAGMGYENNSKAAVITRSLGEMTRVGQAYGASPLTFLTLAGVGDLFLTCSSANSRNYTVGYQLGQGKKLDDIIKNLGSVAEGVSTTKGLHEILELIGVDAPIANAMYSLLYEDASAGEVAKSLMERPPAKREIPFVKESGEATKLLRRLAAIDEPESRVK